MSNDVWQKKGDVDPGFPRLVGRREMARLLAVSERSLTNYLGLGMPSLILGGRRLFDPYEVMAWIRGRQQQQKPAE
jgi:hypothetical protein